MNTEHCYKIRRTKIESKKNVRKGLNCAQGKGNQEGGHEPLGKPGDGKKKEKEKKSTTLADQVAS